MLDTKFDRRNCSNGTGFSKSIRYRVGSFFCSCIVNFSSVISSLIATICKPPFLCCTVVFAGCLFPAHPVESNARTMQLLIRKRVSDLFIIMDYPPLFTMHLLLVNLQIKQQANNVEYLHFQFFLRRLRSQRSFIFTKINHLFWRIWRIYIVGHHLIRVASKYLVHFIKI
jgi:hypothetical protein